MKKTTKTTKSQSYLISDDKGMVLRIETEGKWLIVTSPFDPELITQVRSVDEIFPMAYDVKRGLEAVRAEAARARNKEAASPASRPRKAPAASAKRPTRRPKRIEVRS